jgi:hypothetical protein
MPGILIDLTGGKKKMSRGSLLQVFSMLFSAGSFGLDTNVATIFLYFTVLSFLF